MRCTRTVRALVALTLVASVGLGCATPRSAEPSSFAITRDAPPSRPGRVAVVVAEPQRADVLAALRDRGIERIDVTALYEQLADAAWVVDRFAGPLPFPVSPQAAALWKQGAEACLARGGPAPASRNAVAADCAAQLGPLVFETHVASLAVDAVLIVTPNGVARAYVPGSRRERAVQPPRGPPEKTAQTVDRLFAEPPGIRTVSFDPPLPPAISDPLLHKAFTGLDRNPNGGCERAFPHRIVVKGETPFARALEEAWQMLPERQRTGPDVTCKAGAATWQHGEDGVAGGGWLDCAPALLPVGVFVDDPTGKSAMTRLAELLVDRAVTDSCTFER